MRHDDGSASSERRGESSSRRRREETDRGGDRRREEEQDRHRHRSHDRKESRRRHEYARDDEKIVNTDVERGGSERERHRHKRRRSRSRSPRERKERHRHHDGHERDRSHSTRRARHHSEQQAGGKEEEGDPSRGGVHIYDADEQSGSAVVADRAGVTEQFVDTLDNIGQEMSSTIPTSDSLQVRSHAPSVHDAEQTAEIPQQPASETQIRRDDWMLSGHDQAAIQHQTGSSGGDAEDVRDETDFFSALGGTGRQRAPKTAKPDPDQLHISSRELNTQFAQGKHLDDYDDPRAKASEPKLGGPGHQWRMMKLRRVYEAADEEGRHVEDVALERYGTLDAFNEARAERQYLDDKATHPSSGRGTGLSSRGESPRSGARSGTTSQPLSRQSSSFRKPGQASGTSTPQASRPSALRQSSTLHDQQTSKPSTPVPNVFAPAPSVPASTHAERVQGTGTETSGPPLDAKSLNKLSAKVMRAEMMRAPDAAELRQKLEMEQARANTGGDKGFHETSTGADPSGAQASPSHVQVLPTLDARGRLYDVGKGQQSSTTAPTSTNKKRKENFETRDSKTGELLRYNADDDEQTLADLVREEKYSAGMASQKNMDAEFASRIMGDKSFKAGVDYLDDNVERLARKKMKSDALKRQFAINDFARTKKALDTCVYCWQDETPPKATIVSSGTRAYLAIPDTEPFLPGHCLIVPIQHHLSMLEADEDTWEEVKNFMKCLIQMSAEQQKGVLFFETVKSLKTQRHTVIEAMPIEQTLFATLPGYFRQSILDVGEEWSQNKKIIHFTPERPFRNAMVPQLPYFMVQFDHRGAKGYGHVIETGDGFEADENGEGAAGDVGSRGGSGNFPHWFAAEVIGNLLEYEPRQWRKPRRLQGHERGEQCARFRRQWAKFDWTPMFQHPT